MSVEARGWLDLGASNENLGAVLPPDPNEEVPQQLEQIQPAELTKNASPENAASQAKIPPSIEPVPGQLSPASAPLSERLQEMLTELLFVVRAHVVPNHHLQVPLAVALFSTALLSPSKLLTGAVAAPEAVSPPAAPVSFKETRDIHLPTPEATIPQGELDRLKNLVASQIGRPLGGTTGVQCKTVDTNKVQTEISPLSKNGVSTVQFGRYEGECVNDQLCYEIRIPFHTDFAHSPLNVSDRPDRSALCWATHYGSEAHINR